MNTGEKNLGEIFGVFLKLGLTSFGGPAVHIAMMAEEFVRKRKWLSQEEFLDLLGATNLIPGPNSTEMAMHIGMKRAGWAGFAVAGLSFIFPAVCIVLALSWCYTRYGQLPNAAGFLAGVRPVIIAMLAVAMYSLGKTALKNGLLVAMAILVAIAHFLGAHELILLLGAGIAIAFESTRASIKRGSSNGSTLLLLPAISLASASRASAAVIAAAASISLFSLFAFFLKVGSILYGSGYVLFAYIRADLVDRLGWLSDAQLLDAIAIGQMTPGPLFTSATFIGYLLGGLPGAIVATIGIFLPAFFFVAISAPLVSHARESQATRAFLDGVNAASLALMAAVTIHLARPVCSDPWLVLATVFCGIILVTTKVNSALLLLAAGLMGAFLG